jgi:hypothetical protein
LIERSILVSAIVTLMLASAMPLLLMPTLQSVEGQFLGDDDSALSGFNNSTTTNNETATTTMAEGMDNEELQLHLSATSNNNNTLLSEHVKTIRYYVVALLREAIKDRVGEGNADNARFEVIGSDGNTNSSHTTVGIDDAVSLMRSEFSKLSRASGDSTTAGFEITLDSSQCSSPSAGECQFTITAAKTAEGMDNEGLQLHLLATSNNNNTLLSEYVKTIRFYAVPLLREAIEDRVGEKNENADNVRFVIVGFDGNTNHTNVGTDDAVSSIRHEFNKLSRASQSSATAGFEITLDSSQCSSPSAGECQFTIRLVQKANQAAEAGEASSFSQSLLQEETNTTEAGEGSDITPELNQSESNEASVDDEEDEGDDNGDDSENNDDSSSSNDNDEDNDDNGNNNDDDNELTTFEEEETLRDEESDDAESDDNDNDDETDSNRRSNTLTNTLEDIFSDDNDNNDDSSSSNDDNDDETDSNMISNTLTNKLDDIFSDRLAIAADRMKNSVLDRITEDKAQIRQTIEQIAEQIADATDTD